MPLTPEFKESILKHAVASGRDANCFFQSFFHTLTYQPDPIIKAIEANYKSAVNTFVETVNKELQLNPQIDFSEIIKISKSLHPLEREYIFSPLLRLSYNAMVDQGMLAGDKLALHPDAIVMQPQTIQFANAFGAKISAYMDQKQFNTMPTDIAEQIKATRFDIGDEIYYCDCPASQNLAKGKFFDLNLVYADKHLNYTLGDTKLNEEQLRQVTVSHTTNGGVFATSPAPETKASLLTLPISEAKKALAHRIDLQRNQTTTPPSSADSSPPRARL